MAITMKSLANAGKKLFTKMDADEIIQEGISGKLMPYRFSKGAGAAIVGISAATAAGSEVKNAYMSAGHGYTKMAENLDRLISIDGTGFASKVSEISDGDRTITKDIVKNTFVNPNQQFAHNNLVFALHNRRDG